MSAQHHASFWEQVDTGALVVDAQRRIVDSNPAALRLLGSRNGELTRKNPAGGHAFLRVYRPAQRGAGHGRKSAAGDQARQRFAGPHAARQHFADYLPGGNAVLSGSAR